MEFKIPEVSIIIPFNNVENYIEQCLNTVINQTLKDIEIILINDASTDKSRDIVLNFMQKDKRIKLLELNERKGQGFARNRGIETAKGRYIGFVDSDDFIERDMFEKMNNAAKNSDADIIMCLVKEYDDLNEKYITSDYYSLSVLSNMENSIFSAEDTKEKILDINVALWNKIYKRSYLEKIGEKFPEGFIYEDLPFFFGTYLPAKKIQILWEFLYNYRINRKNSTMQQFNNKILDRLPMVSSTYEKLKNTVYLKDLQYKIKGWIINDLFHRYTLLKENYHKEFFFQMKKIFESLEINDIDNQYWKRVYHFQGYLMVINNTFEDFNQKVFTEYLDIHKVEDRLRSEMSNTEEIDRRFNLIYSDLDKNYEYTKELFEKTSKKAEEFSSDINNRFSNLFKEISNSGKENIEALEKKSIEIEQRTDSKISVIYDEISKNYEYTNEIKDNLTLYSQEHFNSLEQLFNENLKNNIILTDEKISKIYDEISKNYKYTEDLAASNYNNLNNEIQKSDNRISQIYDEITQNYEKTNDLLESYSQDLNNNIEALYEEIKNSNNKTVELIRKETEETEKKTVNKVSQIYNEISKNQKLAEDLIISRSKNLYNDIKDLSYILNSNFEELKTEQRNIIDREENIKNNINFLQKEIKEKFSEIKTDLLLENNNKHEKVLNIIENTEKNILSYIDKIQAEIQTEKDNTAQSLTELKKELYTEFEQKLLKYDEKIASLQQQLIDKEIQLREEMKSPLQKLIDKYNKREK